MSLREPLLDEQSYFSMRDFREQNVVAKLLTSIQDRRAEPDDLANLKRRLFAATWQIALLNYSGGVSLVRTGIEVQRAIDAFTQFMADDSASLDHIDLAIQDNYVEALWLLSLTKLLHLGDEHIECIANIYAADESNDGADELFELILAKLGRKSFEAEGLIHEDPYQLLLDCIKAEPEQRPALMKQFLKRWFKGQKECDWWGSHVPRKGTTVLDTGFFGYWAFEAALVTYLWDIDDASYRDLPHYPKDLIDHARANWPFDKNTGVPTSLTSPTRCDANQPCPRTGWWVTPAKTNSRRLFQQGELMPDFKSDYGMTIWQWDSKQN